MANLTFQNESVEPGASMSGERGAPEGEESRFRASLSQSFLDLLHPLTKGLCFLFLGLAAVNSQISPPESVRWVVSFDLGSAAIFLFIHLLVRSGKVTARLAHPIGAAIGIVSFINGLQALVVSGNPGDSLITILVVLAIGCMNLSFPWTCFTLSVGLASWASLASGILTHPEFVQYSFFMVATGGFSLVIQSVRLRHYRKLYDLHLQEDRQREALHRALDSAKREISERKQIEERLRDSEENYRRIVEMSPVATVVHRDGVVLFSNPAAREILGVAETEGVEDTIVGRKIGEYLHSDSMKLVAVRMKHIKETGKGLPFTEAQVVRADGKTVAVEVAGTPVTYQGEMAIQGIFLDASARKRQEKDLRIMQYVMEHAGEAIFWIDDHAHIVYGNKATCELLGYSQEELATLRVSDIDPYYTLETSKDSRNQIRQGKVVTMERVYRDKQGRDIDVEFSINSIRYEDKALHIVFLRDITERKKAEEEKATLESQLQQVIKMEAVGTLAGGIAHDFNNLLTGILGYSNILKLDSKPGEKVFKAADVIERAAERAKDLTSQLLGFARKGKHQSVTIDAQSTIQEAITLLERTIHKNISITLRHRAVGSRIEGDPNQLQQVFLNLAVNARDAMPEGGELIFETDRVLLDEDYCSRRAGATPGSYLMIAMTDTGTGIPKDVQERIFEPFFTTKEVGQGTGMGLAMVYGIVKNHGGSIEVYSEPGRGTTFKVYLPESTHCAEVLIPTESTHPIRGQGQIMVVDDEEIVRELASDMLEHLGYCVVALASGQEAVDYYTEHKNDIELAIIDMVMPEMDGKRCFGLLKEIDPEIRAILSTGYGRDGAAQEIIDMGMVGFAQKPYRANQLSEVVANAMS